MAEPTLAVLDVDGTLVDSNYQHTLAWYGALREHGHTVSMFRVHRLIGMGGDQLVRALLGDEVEEREGDAIRETEGERYLERYIDTVQPLEGARELIVRLKDAGRRVVLASSAKPDEVEHYLDLLDARQLADAWTTSGDVEQTKPEPDLIRAALAKLDGDLAVMVGDSTWDCKAARNAGVETLAVLTGGFSAQELFDAGALSVFTSMPELLDRLDATVLG
jgi:HAD superfamily hydrolase (TIGR01549 family)